MPLEQDIPGLRRMSNYCDVKCGANKLYTHVARPVAHGMYHAGKALFRLNSEEWARSKDQFSKFGTGQTQTEYLEAYRVQQKAKAKKTKKPKKAKKAENKNKS